MYPYEFPGGKTMYFSTRVGDIKEHEGGELGVNDLLKKAGFPGADSRADENVLDIEGAILVPKKVNFTTNSLMVYEYMRSSTGYEGSLDTFVNDSIVFMFKQTGKVMKIGPKDDTILF